MFFSGDFSTQKKVSLRGRSQEQDRKKLLEQARLERERRHREKLERQSASKIQAFYRGRTAAALYRSRVRQRWQAQYGARGEAGTWFELGAESRFLPELLFFFRADSEGDVSCLESACRLLLSAAEQRGLAALLPRPTTIDVWHAVLLRRLQGLASCCLDTLRTHQASYLPHLLQPPSQHLLQTGAVQGPLLLQTLALLISPGTLQPSPGTLQTSHSSTIATIDAGAEGSTWWWWWAVLGHLVQRGLFPVLRGYLSADIPPALRRPTISVLEQGCLLTFRHYCEGRARGLRDDTGSTDMFEAENLSVPLLFQRWPSLKQVLTDGPAWRESIHVLATLLPTLSTRLPPSLSPTQPSALALLGNLLDVGLSSLPPGEVTLQLVTEFTSVCQHLLEQLPDLKTPRLEAQDEDDMDVDAQDLLASPTLPDQQLQQQLDKVAEKALITNMVRSALPLDSDAVASRTAASASTTDRPSPSEASAVTSLCLFLHTASHRMPQQRSALGTGLAFSAQIVPRLWRFMKRCHLGREWPVVELPGRPPSLEGIPAESAGWLVVLGVFCPVYSYLLATLDSEEFYERQYPLPLEDLVLLVGLVKEAVGHLLWSVGSRPSTSTLPAPPFDAPFLSLPYAFTTSGAGELAPPAAAFLSHVTRSASRFLAQLHDWNSHRRFTSPETFHAEGVVDEKFLIQALDDGSRARELLRKAPYLVPFTDRVRVYQGLLSRARELFVWARHSFSTTNHVTIRRDHILEDGFSQLNNLGEVLKGRVRIRFVNEFGAEEAGVDGGGLFKDFVENIVKVAFDVQYGLFKETADHHLYPNPASHLVTSDHLEYFEFLGRILGKAMYEGILVDIPFATFFLSKLRNKVNHLTDLPSLDPELYRSLIILKHYDGDVADLCLFFTVEDNEYGEKTETELMPGGKDIQVTTENRIRYIHLVANHRLNTQIRKQSQAFLDGFRELIDSEWISFFNEPELQMLISGSREGTDLEDLRQYVHYSGGYHENHPVIKMFWEAVQAFTAEEQSKLLKFVTGCSRGPLLGFKYLEPSFAIHRAAGELETPDVLERLPTSATCMNLLKLPPYKSVQMIRQKLRYAINAGSGFDLS